MLNKKFVTFAGAAALLFVAGQVMAAPSAQDIAKLGNELTPMGAERAANADGSIPAWEGGIRSSAEAGFPDFQSGGHHPDPYAADQQLFTINAANMAQYADNLTTGHKALIQAYPDSYFMPVYQTRRSAAYPQRIYDATHSLASTATLADGGNGVLNSAVGIPFPIPDQGVQVIWNHILRYRADMAKRAIGQAAVTRGGAFTMVKFQDQYMAAYSMPGATFEGLDNVIIYFRQKVVAPARLAGEILLVHETLDQTKDHRRAWLYNPGQRRVRRAPNVAFDNPRTASDGQATSDQLDVYNGSPERYDWTLVGKKEIYIPYNSYKLHSSDLTYKDVLKPLHIDQNLTRYEKHRVWEIDANLKAGTRHLYKRRTFYIDEDSWQIMAVDCYDARDQIWRVQEGHSINYYDVPNFWYTLEMTYDLQSGRYLGIGLNNEERKTYDYNVSLSKKDFSQGALRRAGTR